MATATIMQVPDETELLAFFEGLPIEAAPEDGFWCYEVKDIQGCTLLFSFNTFERSVQTIVGVGDTILCSVSHEGATTIRLGQREGTQCLRAEFELGTNRGTLVLFWKQGIRCEWSDLLTSTT